MQRGRGRADARRGPRVTDPSAVVAAIVPAAGRGERAGTTSDQPKQFLPLGGRALFRWAVDALHAAGCDPIVLVLPESALPVTEADDVRQVAGGPTRQDSVWNGLQNIDTEFVVVHDAARPFVTKDLIVGVIDGLKDADACIAAMPVDETLKRVSDQLVESTIDRSILWRAQTPAAFRTAALKEAHRRAHAEGFVGTDESQLIERIGGSIRIVPGRRDNLKVTFPEDFAVAEAMLSARPQ